MHQIMHSLGIEPMTLALLGAMQDCLSYKHMLRFRLKFEIATAYFLNIPPDLECM